MKEANNTEPTDTKSSWPSPAERRLTEFYLKAEEMDTERMIETIRNAPRHPPKERPYKPPFARLPKSDDLYRQMIALGVQAAETEARRMLALKTQRVESGMGRTDAPPDLWSGLEEAHRYQRPPRS